MPLPFIYRIVQVSGGRLIPDPIPCLTMYTLAPQGEGFNYIPVIRYHGPLEGVVSREVGVNIT